jgi:hypothetical protein
VEAELRSLGEPPPPDDKRVYEWRSSRLVGRRFVEEGDVDEALSEVADELKAQIREGFLVVVK